MGRGDAPHVPFRVDTLADSDLIAMRKDEAKANRLAAWSFAATSRCQHPVCRD